MLDKIIEFSYFKKQIFGITRKWWNLKMKFEYLNDMIEYIEKNLAEEIDYKKLAKIVGVS